MKSILYKPFLAKQVRDGNKTQTRRIMIVDNALDLTGWTVESTSSYYFGPIGSERIKVTPKYKIGETIYIKETFEINGAYSENLLRFWVDIKYNDGKTESFAVEQEVFEKYCEKVGKKYSPLFMPEIFARTFLKITNIRAEKLQDISEDDAIAEGVEALFDNAFGDDFYQNYLEPSGREYLNSARGSFQTLWDSINGKDESKCWDANNWVFVYEFKEEKCQ